MSKANFIMFILCALMCALNIEANNIGIGVFIGFCGIGNLLLAVRG